MKSQFMSVAFALGLVSNVAQAAEHFSIKPYLAKCGGKVYAKCDSPELNQSTIYEIGRAEAIKNKLDIMLVMGADWCPSCLVFNKMLSKDKDIDKLHEKVVVIEINGDVDSGKELAKRLKITGTGYPQAFILKAKDNDLIQQFFPSRFSNVLDLVQMITKPAAVAEVAKEKPEAVGQVKVSTLELPIEISGDYGVSTFIQNPKDKADLFINQGVAALQVYHYVDAYRSFRMAELLKSESVMAQVGQIFAIINIDGASAQGFFGQQAFKKIEVIRAKQPLSAAEDAWGAFAESYKMANMGDYVKRPGHDIKPMIDALADLRTADKTNLDGHALAGWFAINALGKDVRPMFQSILKQLPNNIGAHHSLLHLAEMENKAQEADVHATALAKLAPRSAHALHMYGHTLPQQGRWAEALVYFKKADTIHDEWARKNRVEATQDWHYSHNRDLMAATYLGLGDLTNAMGTWMTAMTDARALLHVVDLSLIVWEKGQADMWLKVLENGGWSQVVKDQRQELDLTPESAKTLGKDIDATEHRTDYQKLMDRVYANYAQNGTKANPALTGEVTAFFSKNFKAGGFDGWSNAYLKLLRMKRVAKILSMPWLVEDLDGLEFAVKSGALCGSSEKEKSLVRCVP